MTTEEARKQAGDIIEFWRPILNLRDWHISVGFVYPHQFENYDRTIGAVKQDFRTETAVINLIKPELYSWDLHPEYNIEHCILHEMLHIAFGVGPNADDVFMSEMFERGLERVVKGLLRLRYDN